MIPADRPYVGLLVIKIFPAYLLPGRSEALTKTTSEDAQHRSYISVVGRRPQDAQTEEH